MHATRNMGEKVVSWIFFLHLLVIMSSNGSRAREMAGTENKHLDNAQEEGDTHQPAHRDHHAHAHFTTHMDHIDPSVMVFFTLNDLKVGKRMPIHFPKRDPATSPRLWPREKAESVPFSLNQMQHLLKFFSFSPDSSQAKAMEDTLRECESKPIKGENYTILENIIEIQAPKMVACHTMPYPYAVFYCHSQESENRLYKIPLAGDNGDRVEAMVVCHLDTSQWGHGHVAFQVLKVMPGSSSVCHFFPADHPIWVPKLQSNGFSTM
ncbi:BURP domain-containing protein BNM2A-like [Gastrolobium bilobum]|uniref:BURP domain-containing protein BNM2A-like n=1 Tax=Gastrolobium bilobum TaxID=150636 RepID=UPI002AB15FDA|nr:BURP domain-containing protein BNM2A-like [Gastrolobium bilobum]